VCPTIPDRPQRSHPRPTDDAAEPADAESFPNWFTQFLNDRQTRKPSAHTMKAYRQDFIAIANLVTDGKPAGLTAQAWKKPSCDEKYVTVVGLLRPPQSRPSIKSWPTPLPAPALSNRAKSRAM
jgi:hypothetical protein